MTPAPLLAGIDPAELREIMRTLGCPTLATLGRRIGVHRSTVAGWRAGTVGVPRPIAMLLRMLVAEAA